MPCCFFSSSFSYFLHSFSCALFCCCCYCYCWCCYFIIPPGGGHFLFSFLVFIAHFIYFPLIYILILAFLSASFRVCSSSALFPLPFPSPYYITSIISLLRRHIARSLNHRIIYLVRKNHSDIKNIVTIMHAQDSQKNQQS